MAKQIHLHSEALGRDFTFEEWGDYLKEHPNASRTPVVECGVFQFNVNDVCINPQVPVCESERGWGFKVEVAKVPMVDGVIRLRGLFPPHHILICLNLLGILAKDMQQ
jgi:hypothetical protein